VPGNFHSPHFCCSLLFLPFVLKIFTALIFVVHCCFCPLYSKFSQPSFLLFIVVFALCPQNFHSPHFCCLLLFLPFVLKIFTALIFVVYCCFCPLSSKFPQPSFLLFIVVFALCSQNIQSPDFCCPSTKCSVSHHITILFFFKFFVFCPLSSKIFRQLRPCRLLENYEVKGTSHSLLLIWNEVRKLWKQRQRQRKCCPSREDSKFTVESRVGPRGNSA
jgi:hypothetical protein